MKGSNTFTEKDIDELRRLIAQKLKTPSEDQVNVRDKMRGLGFYISDFGYYRGGFRPDDLDALIKSGRITVVQTAESAPTETVSVPPHLARRRRKSIQSTHQARTQRDEHYILDLCDQLLKVPSSRQHHFPFLLGDAGTPLPLDAYYPKLNLVIEYRERQHTEPVLHFDKPDRLTVSGVHRGEQRRIYDQRRRDVLRDKEIDLLEISFSDFHHTRRKRLIRDTQRDTEILKYLLAKWLE